jgi:hypothetical protein
MSIRSILFAAAFGIASVAAARADDVRPMEGKSIDLGGISGIAYYTVEHDEPARLPKGKKQEEAFL